MESYTKDTRGFEWAVRWVGMCSTWEAGLERRASGGHGEWASRGGQGGG